MRRSARSAVRVLSRLFRRLMLSKLADAHRAGRLAFFGELAHLSDPQAFAAFLAPLKTKDWFVYAKPPFAGPEAVERADPHDNLSQEPQAGYCVGAVKQSRNRSTIGRHAERRPRNFSFGRGSSDGNRE